MQKNTKQNKVYFVKSLEKDLILKTIKNQKKVPFQTVDDIVKRKLIKPNTKSFGYERRLSCTLLGEYYTKTYRAQGIIFSTNQHPDYIAPFDISLLTQNNNLVTQYYRIENNLHVYYNHKLIPGFEQFIFSELKAMLKKFPSPQIAWREVNDFREHSGFKKLPKQKYRLASYNEVIFHKAVSITPVALFGYLPAVRKKARELGLPHFTSAKKFFEKMS